MMDVDTTPVAVLPVQAAPAYPAPARAAAAATIYQGSTPHESKPSEANSAAAASGTKLADDAAPHPMTPQAPAEAAKPGPRDASHAPGSPGAAEMVDAAHPGLRYVSDWGKSAAGRAFLRKHVKPEFSDELLAYIVVENERKVGHPRKFFKCHGRDNAVELPNLVKVENYLRQLEKKLASEARKAAGPASATDAMDTPPATAAKAPAPASATATLTLGVFGDYLVKTEDSVVTYRVATATRAGALLDLPASTVRAIADDPSWQKVRNVSIERVTATTVLEGRSIVPDPTCLLVKARVM